MEPQPHFFTIGGTVPPEGLYIPRSSDEQLYQAALAGEYCNVLTPRQMGKSSLMVHTANRLYQLGVRAAMIDLTKIGTGLSAEEWYFGLVRCLKQELCLAIDEQGWWQQNQSQGGVQRFSDFLREVVLEEIAGPVIVFIDEIDSTLSLPFTDDFFAAIRAMYNNRASDPVYKRLTFVLLGVARPADLIKDRTRTPYNIGQTVDLKDFSLEEARALLPGFSPAQSEPLGAVLERILYWTNGHPYLTQVVCARIAADLLHHWSDAAVDILIKRLFLSDEARKESNLQFIRDQVYTCKDREKVLKVYRQVLSGAIVRDEERDPIKSLLKLMGLVKVTENGNLMVRNRIYAAFFSAAWIKEAMPKFNSTRVTIASIVIAVISLAFASYFMYNQLNSDEIRARTYDSGFREAQSAEVRITNLAGLFRLGKGYPERARQLFFSLPPEDQLALFAALENPQDLGDDVKEVMVGLYTYLQNKEAHNRLLEAMQQTLELMAVNSPDYRSLRAEIKSWLQGRRYALQGDTVKAIDEYRYAIAFNPNNPGTHIDLFLAYAGVADYGKALHELNTVLQLDPARKETASALLISNPGLISYLSSHAADYPDLKPFVK